MKKMICLILTIIIVGSVFAGCQKTPESPIVIGKGNGVLETELLEEQTESVIYPSIKMWKTELETNDGEISIHVNAKVNWPEKADLPVVYVRPHAITTDEVNVAAKELFGDVPLYDASHYTDKNRLEQEIIAWRADLESLETNGTWSEISLAGSPGLPSDYVEEEIEWVKSKIEEAENNYQKAPDTVPVITEIVFRQLNGYKSLSLRNDDRIPADLGVSIMDETDDSYLEFRDWNGVIYNGFSDLQEDDALDLTISKEEALNLSVGFVEKLGIDASVTNIQGIKSNGAVAYLFIFSRNIEGIPCKYVESTGGALGIDGSEFRNPWNAERIEVMVNDDGIIGFEWESPPEIIETINENVSIKAYDEIIEIAEKILPMQFAKEVLAENKREITICEMSMNMMRVAKRGTDNEYYYLPVWDLLGYYGDEENKDTESTNRKRAFLTINAVDGSVIDRNIGF